MKLSTPLLLAGILALTILVLTGCNSNSQESQVVQGPVLVFYEIQVTPKNTFGTGPKGTEVSDIHFCTNCIILKSDRGRGTVLPLAKVNYFRWQKKA